ncbi:MAG: 50S ribosomal protein L24 [Candidatus Moraniibacteriota bacterium]|nr:MAG: 50S ribosomal protein L24 [Candidatus Moranbacteria bacterium]
MKFKKGDTIQMIAGKDKGKRGTVLRIFPSLLKMTVEGVNIRKKHIRSRKEGSPGERVEFPAAFSVEKAMLVCPHTDKPTRIGYRFEGGEKIRISKRSGKPLA